MTLKPGNIIKFECSHKICIGKVIRIRSRGENVILPLLPGCGTVKKLDWCVCKEGVDKLLGIKDKDFFLSKEEKVAILKYLLTGVK